MRNNSIYEWLELVLYERFGHVFILEDRNDNVLQLKLEGSQQYITLQAGQPSFNHSSSDIPICYWDASAEGWEAIFGLLPAPGYSNLHSPLITHTPNGMDVAYDVMGLIYWMLTRKEEVGRTDLDEHMRFPATSSHAYKHGYLERPVVDEWLDILGQVIQRTWPGIELKQNNFSMKVSHDVDQPSLYAFKSWWRIARIMGGHFIKRRDVHALIQTLYIKIASFNRIHESDPFNTFNWIMDESELRGLSSVFNFICLNSDPLDGDYKLEDPRIRQLIRKISQRGHEIGLHPSYRSYKNPEMIRREFLHLLEICREEKVAQSKWGGRMHYLRWSQPETLRYLVNSGLDYDMSLGYADRPGFRCGTCFEYPAYDPIARKKLNFRIRPLILMESSLFGERYLGFGVGPQSESVALLLKNTCRKVNGVFSLLWHNSTFTTSIQKDMYLRILSK